MQITPINNTQNSNTNFKKLVIHDNAAKIIKQLPEKDAALIKTWEEKLANTKHFDLKLYESLFPFIKSKKFQDWTVEGKAKVGDAIGTRLMVKFPDAVDCGFPHFLDLQFATSEKTNAVRNSLLKENNIYSSNEEINELGRAVNTVEALEESFEYRDIRLKAEEKEAQEAEAKQAEAKKNASFLDKVLEKIGLKRI